MGLVSCMSSELISTLCEKTSIHSYFIHKVYTISPGKMIWLKNHNASLVYCLFSCVLFLFSSLPDVQESQRTHGQLTLLCYSETAWQSWIYYVSFSSSTSVCKCVYDHVCQQENTVNECFKSEIDILLLELNKILHLTAMK